MYGVMQSGSLLQPPVSLSVRDLELSNLRRTRYLLRHYSDFAARQPPDLSLPVSQAVLEILSFSLADHADDSTEDYQLMDHCGPFLAPAILHAAEEIKGFPPDVSAKIYPILYWQYFSPNGTAIDIPQLLQRLKAEDLSLTDEEAARRLSDGEKMMSALLFPSPFITAMRACG